MNSSEVTRSHMPFHSASEAGHEIQQEQVVSPTDRNSESAVQLDEKATSRSSCPQLQQQLRQQPPQRQCELQPRQPLRNASGLPQNKFILDACCGGRMFWFNKHHPNVLYIDIRKEEKGLIKSRRKFCVKPDEIMDFRDLKFPDNSFKLVVWDPPHLKRLGKTSYMAKKYGILSDSWRQDLSKGFQECWRVLDGGGGF